MKWMYLEQETKEAYLRAILCDPPEVIDQKDNDELGQSVVYRVCGLLLLLLALVVGLIGRWYNRGKKAKDE